MTKQELMETYTAEQLAAMVVDLQNIIFNVLELRQIAEHLLVYCNHNGEVEMKNIERDKDCQYRDLCEKMYRDEKDFSCNGIEKCEHYDGYSKGEFLAILFG